MPWPANPAAIHWFSRFGTAPTKGNESMLDVSIPVQQPPSLTSRASSGGLRLGQPATSEDGQDWKNSGTPGICLSSSSFRKQSSGLCTNSCLPPPRMMAL